MARMTKQQQAQEAELLAAIAAAEIPFRATRGAEERAAYNAAHQALADWKTANDLHPKRVPVKFLGPAWVQRRATEQRAEADRAFAKAKAAKGRA